MKEIREKLKELKVSIGEKARELLEKIREEGKNYFKKILEKFGLGKRAIEMHAEAFLMESEYVHFNFLNSPIPQKLMHALKLLKKNRIIPMTTVFYNNSDILIRY